MSKAIKKNLTLISAGSILFFLGFQFHIILLRNFRLNKSFILVLFFIYPLYMVTSLAMILHGLISIFVENLPFLIIFDVFILSFLIFLMNSTILSVCYFSHLLPKVILNKLKPSMKYISDFLKFEEVWNVLDSGREKNQENYVQVLESKIKYNLVENFWETLIILFVSFFVIIILFIWEFRKNIRLISKPISRISMIKVTKERNKTEIDKIEYDISQEITEIIEKEENEKKYLK